jgi:hypothetical protein
MDRKEILVCNTRGCQVCSDACIKYTHTACVCDPLGPKAQNMNMHAYLAYRHTNAVAMKSMSASL